MAAGRCGWARSRAWVLTCAVLAAGCTADASASNRTTAATVGDVGRLPGSFGGYEASGPAGPTQPGIEVGSTGDDAPDASSSPAGAGGSDPGHGEVSTESGSVTPVPAPPPQPDPVGSLVTGNRLLMIGDSLTASISRRYGGQACDALVPLGWQVEVDAETGRFVDFGARVLDKRLSAGWDAAVLFLGNNYGGDRGVYQLALHSLLLRLYPRPTVLLTTSLFRPKQADVNAAITEEAAMFTNVRVIDWQTISEDPALTGDDNLHLSELGRARLGLELANVLGTPPVQPGQCLTTTYRDDSAGSPNGPAGSSSTKTTTRSTTKTTTRSTTKSTTKSSATPTPTTAAGSSTGGQTTTSTKAPVTSAAPAPVTTSARTAPASTVAVVTLPQTSAAVSSSAVSSSAAPSTAAPSTAAQSSVAPTTAAPTTAAVTTAPPAG